MSALSYDIARCADSTCPSQKPCARYVPKNTLTKGVVFLYGAFYARRGDADKCDGYLPRITSPLPDDERKALDAACSTSL